MRACLSTWLSNFVLNSTVYVPEKVLFLHWGTGTNRRGTWIPCRRGTKFHLSFSITLNERAGKLPVSDLGPIYCTTLWTLCKSSTPLSLSCAFKTKKRNPSKLTAQDRSATSKEEEQKMSFLPSETPEQKLGGREKVHFSSSSFFPARFLEITHFPFFPRSFLRDSLVGHIRVRTFEPSPSPKCGYVQGFSR